MHELDVFGITATVFTQTSSTLANNIYHPDAAIYIRKKSLPFSPSVSS